MLLETNIKGTAFIIGRFQPITKLHYKIIDDARKNYQQMFVVIVNQKSLSRAQKYTKKGEMRIPAKRRIEANPFSLALRIKLINKAFGGKLPNSNIISAEDGFTPDVINKIMRYISKEKLKQKIILLAGSDRVESYKKQISTALELDVPVEIKEITRNMDSADNISATKVRNAIKLDDLKMFKDLTPVGIHDEFNNLKKYLVIESRHTFFKRMLKEVN